MFFSVAILVLNKYKKVLLPFTTNTSYENYRATALYYMEYSYVKDLAFQKTDLSLLRKSLVYRHIILLNIKG